MDSNVTRHPVALDLFAGAGGLAEGLESAGIRVVAAVELHPQAALTHAFNHPRTHVFAGDIKMLNAELVADVVECRTGRRSVDIVVGGPPCQGFSTAGKKQSDDPRNNLFLEFVRFVDHFQPSVFILENVPGFKKMHQGHAYIAAAEMFANLGYHVQDDLLQAADFGVPQRRLRFVMIGVRSDAKLDFLWPRATHASGQQGSLFSGVLPLPPTVGDALEDLSFLEPGWEAHRQRGDAKSHFAHERVAGGSLLFNHLATRHREKAVRIFELIEEGMSIGSVPGAKSLTAKATMARMHRDRISNAVLALPDDMIHYGHHRIPTVREMARLQSFDDDYVFFGKRTSGFVERTVDVPQYTQVGNAVPPLLARALGKAVCAALGAPEGDVRDLEERRRRHAWVMGSSGYSGYSLDESAVGRIRIADVSGSAVGLPISVGDVPVGMSPALVEWKARPPSRTGQWAPGVPVPAGRRPRRLPSARRGESAVDPIMTAVP